MGRELKRVPLNFDWPMGMIWKGFLNPYRAQPCKSCDEVGYNPETKKISDEFYNFADRTSSWCHRITLDELQALLDANRLWDYWRGFTPGKGWDPDAKPPKASQELLDRVNHDNTPGNRAGFGKSHDGINRFVLIEARARRLGVWGRCRYCKGNGYIFQSKEIARLHKAWKEEEPPSGPGYQLWETTSEGSPKSPVFKTLDALCEWAEHNATTFASERATKEQWKKMLDENFVVAEIAPNAFAF